MMVEAPGGNAVADYYLDFSAVSSFNRVGNAPRLGRRDKRGPLGTRLNDDQDPLRCYPDPQ